MQIEYTITFSDYEKATLLINDKIPTYNKVKFRYSLVIGVAFFFILPFTSFILRFLLTLLFCLLVYSVLFDYWIRFYLKAMLHQEAKENGHKFPKEIILNINKKYFIYSSVTDDKEYTIPWAKVTAAVETHDMYILYTPVFANYYIIKKENEDRDKSENFGQTIKNILNKHYLPIQSPK